MTEFTCSESVVKFETKDIETRLNEHTRAINYQAVLLNKLSRDIKAVREKDICSLNTRYETVIKYLKSLQKFEDCEYPFHAYDDSVQDIVPWTPTDILNEIGEGE